MHTIDFVPKLNIVTIYGGRNDFAGKTAVYSDLWVLRLENLEWFEAKIGGTHLPIPRCNHSSIVIDTELIICGGQGKDYELTKDILAIELDQAVVDRTNPIALRLGTQVHAKLTNIKKSERITKYHQGLQPRTDHTSPRSE